MSRGSKETRPPGAAESSRITNSSQAPPPFTSAPLTGDHIPNRPDLNITPGWRAVEQGQEKKWNWKIATTTLVCSKYTSQQIHIAQVTSDKSTFNHS